MACQIATRMTMLKKGTGMQWRHLVVSDLPSITFLLYLFVGFKVKHCKQESIIKYCRIFNYKVVFRPAVVTESVCLGDYS